MSSSKRYPEEFKIEAVKQVTEHGLLETHFSEKDTGCVAKL
jgi:transposase-like protein